MRVRLLAALGLLLARTAQAQIGGTDNCPIEFALGETLGPPQSNAITVSVIPYDANPANGSLRLCYAAAAGKDALGTAFQTAPAGVTCSAPDAAWAAAERVDFRVTAAPIAANTTIWYKIQCDITASDYWYSRPVYSTKTLPTSGSDNDFTFTLEADNHFGENYWNYDRNGLLADGTNTGCDGECGITDIGAPGGVKCRNSSHPIYGWINLRRSVDQMMQERSAFHINLGDFYMGAWLSGNEIYECPPNKLWSPSYRLGQQGNLNLWAQGGLGDNDFVRDGQYLQPEPGFPLRNQATRSADGIESAWGGYNSQINNNIVDFGGIIVPRNSSAQMYAASRYKVWAAQKFYQPLYASSPMVYAWGNWDYPKWGVGALGAADPAGIDVDGSRNWYFGHGHPRNQAGDLASTYFINAWKDTVVNPNGASYYPNAGGCVTCDGDGQYYTFASGLAQFWVVSPFFGTIGKGNITTSDPFDTTSQLPEHAADWSLGQDQYDWLAASVAASNAKWKFVLMHQLPGGIDTRYKPSAGSVSGGFNHWYGRGTYLSTSGRWCDTNGDGIHDAGETKPCVTDDSITMGLDSDEAAGLTPVAGSGTVPRAAGWETSDGSCPNAVQCKPTPYNNRTAALAGDPTYGAPAIQSLLATAGNIDSNGANFILLGHDHLAIAGCKPDSTGCTEVNYIMSGQPADASSGTTPPPATGGNPNTAGGLWDQYYDLNGDGIADYRSDGAPYPTPTDRDAGTIHSHGSQVRGYHRVNVSNEGVEFDWVSVDHGDHPSWPAGTTVYAYKVSNQALVESDFDGAAAADSESKRAATTPTIAGSWNCDYTTSPAPLEGTQSCRSPIGASDDTLTPPATYTASTNVCADFLWRPVTDGDSATATPLLELRSGATMRARMEVSGATVGATSGTVTVYASGPTSGTTSGILTWGRTYEARLCYTGTGDDSYLKLDVCDANDANCDGKNDSTGAVVTVPTWGTGASASLTANGPGAALTANSYLWTASNASDIEHIIDAFGICDMDTGAFKCGDGFE